MASSSLLLCLFSVLISTASSTSTTISLSPLTGKHASSDPWQRLNHLVTASLTRAHHLKSPKANASSTKTPLFPHSYGGYSISLRFGQPPQTVPLIMDTGSSLVWIPCTSRYVCSRCSFPRLDSAQIPTFIPKNSSSAELVGCRNPKCGWLFGSDVESRCKDCSPGNCTRACPAYLVQYGSGSTAGLLLSETLHFPRRTVPDFVVGCSFFSVRQPAGIAGFGRGRESLPSQMGLKRFSYCLVSHRFDDAPVSSELVLDGAAGGGGVSYTPFRKNPAASNPAFQDYYYVMLRKIVVGDKPVKAPYKYLVPGPDGNGGAIVDSGTTLTYMEKSVFDAVAEEFEKQMANYTRAREVEERSGFRPCFEVSSDKPVAFPALSFHFKGGAKMALPLANYFSFVAGPGVICMTIISDDVTGGAVAGGPAIILGNYQQQNFYIEYDLEKERFGFRKQVCK